MRFISGEEGMKGLNMEITTIIGTREHGKSRS